MTAAKIVIAAGIGLASIWCLARVMMAAKQITRTMTKLAIIGVLSLTACGPSPTLACTDGGLHRNMENGGVSVGSGCP